MHEAQTQSLIPRAEVMFAYLAGIESCEPSPLYGIHHDIKIGVPQYHSYIVLFTDMNAVLIFFSSMFKVKDNFGGLKWLKGTVYEGTAWYKVL